MPKRIYIDMDGTLCRFHDVNHNYIEKMWEQGFYRDLKPFENFLQAVSLCIERNKDNKDVEFYILSAVLDTYPPFAEAEKREWTHTHLPQLKDEQMIFVPAGSDKSAVIGKLDNDSILIDDYNKNLYEWKSNNGKAVKFINDVNNKGLGAYGGEKGKLWDGEFIRYDENAISIAYKLESIAGIEHLSDREYYNFNGDVHYEAFLKLLPKYFEKRKIIDNSVKGQLYRQGESFYSVSDISEQSYKYAKDSVNTKISELSESFIIQNETTEAMMLCLEDCYRIVRTNDISFTKAISWLKAAFSQEKCEINPITQSNLQSFFSSQVSKEKLLKFLHNQIKDYDISLKKLHRQIYMPTSDELAKDVLLNGAYQAAIKSQISKISSDVTELRKEWREIAGTDYPNIICANQKRKSYIDYLKIDDPSINRR